MKSNIFFVLFLSIIFSLFFSCENETAEPEKDDDDPIASCNDTVGSITYDNKIESLITTHCGSNSNACHHEDSSTSGLSLDEYHDVKEAVIDHNFMATIKHENGYIVMPKGAAKLSDCQIAVFQKWVDTGMAEH